MDLALEKAHLFRISSVTASLYMCNVVSLHAVSKASFDYREASKCCRYRKQQGEIFM